MTGSGTITPQSRYDALIRDGALSADSGQKAVIAKLDSLYHTLIKPEKAPSLWGRLTQSYDQRPVQGLYIYGGVGRGKTLLMDLFYECLPEARATRVHFHDFMVMAHDAMNKARADGADDPIIESARTLLSSNRFAHRASKARFERQILCFDEMEVRDIADAMIVKRLFDALFDLNMIVIATSNRHPSELYKGGLHRDRFIPFIDKLETQCTIVEIADGQDWRARLLGKTPRWYVPSNQKTHDKMARQFDMVTGDDACEEICVKVAGREIIFDKVAQNIAFCSFDTLCAVPLAARDYVAIADRLTGLFVVDVPCLDDKLQNEARRFMWLIDALYDRGRFIVASAEVEMEDLYQGRVWGFEFDRTLSRLVEMTRLSHKVE